MEYQTKHKNASQNTRFDLMRLWSFGLITLSSSSLQLLTVIIAHAEKYSTRFTSPCVLGYKQSEHWNILDQILRQSEELENITSWYYKKFGVDLSTVHCHTIQNNYPEMCFNIYTLQNCLYSKTWGFFCLFNNKVPSCKAS